MTSTEEEAEAEPEAEGYQRELVSVLPAHNCTALVVNDDLRITQRKTVIGFAVMKWPDGYLAVYPIGVAGIMDDARDIYILHASGTVESLDAELDDANWASLAAFEQELARAREHAGRKIEEFEREQRKSKLTLIEETSDESGPR